MKNNQKMGQNDLKIGDNSFFIKPPLNSLSTNTSRRVHRTHLIIDFIKKNQGCTPYRISKELEINYTDVCRVIRDLEYCGAIQIKINVVDGRAHKQIFIPAEGKND